MEEKADYSSYLSNHFKGTVQLNYSRFPHPKRLNV